MIVTKKSVLKKQARLILKLFGEGGKHWAKDALAYNYPRGGRRDDARSNQDFSDDRSVSPRSKEAQSWCFLGACYKLKIPYKPLEREIRDYTIFSGMTSFNDRDGWSPVRRLLTRLAKVGTLKDHRLKF